MAIDAIQTTFPQTGQKAHPGLNASPAKFGSLSNVLMHRQFANVPSKVLTKMLEMDQGVNGNAWGMFLADTMTVWAPKAVVSRSLPEFAEMSFLEFVESGLFYFVPALLAGNIFQHMFTKMNPKSRAFATHHLAGDLSKMSPQMLKRVAPVKLAVILASVGTAFVGEYALSFVKNLLTERVFKVNNFDEIANLSEHHKKIKAQGKSKVAKKAYKRIGQCAAFAAACIGVSALMVTRGLRSPGELKFAKFIGRFFDFKYSKDAKGALSFGLGSGQIPIVIYAGAISYTDAARDALERIEVAIRANATAWYLAFGSHWLSRVMLRSFNKQPGFQKTGVITKVKNPQPQFFGWLGGKVVGLFNKNAGEKLTKHFTSELGIMSLDAAEKRALDLARASLKGRQVSEKVLKETAWKLMRNKSLFQQNMLYYIPKAFGALAVSGGIALLSRIMTAQRYDRWKQEGHTYFDDKAQKLQKSQKSPKEPVLPDTIMDQSLETLANKGFHPNRYMPNIYFDASPAVTTAQYQTPFQTAWKFPEAQATPARF